MKYAVVLCDGMADLPMKELDGKTPLMAAKKPNIDELALFGEVGLVKTIPDGMSSGSDVAILSVLGYDPARFYTGRSPLEAISMGVNLLDSDMAFRCNLVTLSNEKDYADKMMIDYSADGISTEDAKVLIEFLAKNLNTEELNFFAGVSYRHCLRWRNAPKDAFKLTPPHDITGQKIGQFLPGGKNAKILTQLMEKSIQLLQTHPINLQRIKRGDRPANSIWLWGEGTKPKLNDFGTKYGIKGATISGVDLIKGIGKACNLEPINVEGATGDFETNYLGKEKAAIKAFNDGYDFVFIHIEAPDECGHRGDLKGKIKAIEQIDEKIVGNLIKDLQALGTEYRLLIMPDHATPVSLKTHTNDYVPYLIYDSRNKLKKGYKYDEVRAKDSLVIVKDCSTLMERFTKNKN
ncbi:MAG: cofactor-independent phosphoglycerate mutase [Firmicutes bacterium]|nr:cofactor-independent phosphoglycerate mutase [Bacillota bacterium]